jgi:NhaC family Na+:H+ antiporter
MTNEQTQISKPLPFWLAASPFVLLIVLFAFGTLYMNAGESLIVLSMLGSATFASAIAVRQGKGWDDIQQSAIDKIASVFPVILILLSIGALIGAWVFSGTIPMIVWIGLQIINPDYIVVTAFFAAALMSIVTGTSWGSAGTIGVALMGIATAIDAPLAIVAGAIVSGAYFGDKMSPLSDSTNIAALGAGADLYGHIRHMTYTAFPSFIVATLVFTFVQTGGGQSDGTLNEAANIMIRDIESAFRLEWFALLPMVVIFFAIARKWPPVLGIVAAAATGAAIGIVGQGFDINDGLLALTTGFNVEMIHSIDRGNGALSQAFLELVNRGGVYSIVNTLVVIIAAFILAGAMDASGALKILVNGLLKRAKSVFSLVATTMASSLVMLSLTSHGGVTCLIVGGLYQDAYKERKLAPVNLSRSLEDSVTLMDPLMPWTVSALFMANTLGVPTLSYFPWAIFCLGGPLFSMLLAAQYRRTGFGLKPLQTKPNP